MLESAAMFFSRHLRRCTALLACLAILLVALAPSVSHALAAKAGAPLLAEICTVEGVKLVQIDTASAASDASDGHTSSHQLLHLEHCPFCSLQPAMGLPPDTRIVLPQVQAPTLAPHLFYQAPHPLFVWAPAQSRAPPSA